RRAREQRRPHHRGRRQARARGGDAGAEGVSRSLSVAWTTIGCLRHSLSSAVAMFRSGEAGETRWSISRTPTTPVCGSTPSHVRPRSSSAFVRHCAAYRCCARHLGRTSTQIKPPVMQSFPCFARFPALGLPQHTPTCVSICLRRVLLPKSSKV